VKEEWEGSNPNSNSTSGPQVVVTDFPSWGNFFDWFASENVAVSTLTFGKRQSSDYVY
jgi:hypothetical protein